jgi:hypothetical protein
MCYTTSNSLFHYKFFSGQIYVDHIYWRQSGTTMDIRRPFKNTLRMHGFQYQHQLY